MNKKIKLYCILLTFIYAFAISYVIISGFADTLSAGFKIGEEDALSGEHTQVFHFKVKPVKGNYSFSDEMLNAYNDRLLPVEINEFKIRLTKSEIYTSNIVFVIVLFVKILFSVLYGAIAIGVFGLFFCMIRPIIKGGIMEESVIYKIKIIGCILVVMFCIEFAFYFIDYLLLKDVIQPKGYKIVMDFPDVFLLILGIVLLLLAEILNVSSKLKKEQELTI